MKQFKNILVVVDQQISHQENSAIAQAAELAQRNNAKVTLMDVITAPDDTVNAYKDIISASELTQMMAKQRDKDLVSMVNELRTNNIDANTKIAIGTNFIEIIRQVLRSGHDLIIKIATGNDSRFASSDFHLMRKSPCPVWLLKQQEVAHCQHILAAVDITQENTDEGKRLNQLIMELATSLAQWKNGNLHLLSCWTLYGESALRHNSFLKVSDSKLASIIDEEQNSLQQRLDAFGANYDSFTFTQHLIKDKPDHGIPKFVERHTIDTVVMGTVGRSGISGLLIGNTAETVLQSIDASVVTVKPSGFKSPVK